MSSNSAMRALIIFPKIERLCATKNKFSLKCCSISNLSQKTTIDEQELSKFSGPSTGNFWWHKNSDDVLHRMNQLRIPFIRDGILQTQPVSPTRLQSSHPLENFKILDVGCGGGILTEPLRRLGADVTGLDPVEDSINYAKTHAERNEDTRKIKYLCTTIDEHAETHSNHYDALVSSEVLEHVADLKLFMTSCIKATKENGSIFITTINKTFLSWLLAIRVAENVLGLLPPGTHDWEKFVPPQELEYMFQSNNCQVRTVHGMLYVPIWNRWRWIADASVNYAMHAVKRSNTDT